MSTFKQQVTRAGAEGAAPTNSTSGSSIHCLSEHCKKQKWDEEGFDDSLAAPSHHCTLESSSALSTEASPTSAAASAFSISSRHGGMTSACWAGTTLGMKGRATLGETPSEETSKRSPATATGWHNQHLNQNSWLWQKGNGDGALCCLKVHPKPPWMWLTGTSTTCGLAASKANLNHQEQQSSQTIPSLPLPKKQPLQGGFIPLNFSPGKIYRP